MGIAILLVCAFPLSAQVKNSVPELFANFPDLHLKVVLVSDDDFEAISEADVRQMLDTAADMFADKFAAPKPAFEIVGSMSIEKFFAENLDRTAADFVDADKRRYKVGEKNDFEIHKKRIIHFLKRWKIKELQGFFAEKERASYDSYEKIYEGIALQMNSKISEISGLKVKDKSILRPEKADYRSYLNWRMAFMQQDKYDVVITNTFILYDDITQPFPHSIFSTCKVGGVSTKAPGLSQLGRRGIMASTFGMDTDIPFFQDPLQGKVNREQRNKIIGAFVIAHEMGHALFKLADQYDHGDECLMNNRKDISYAQGYELLIKNPGPCSRCRMYLESRSLFWDAEHDFEAKKYREAIGKYTQVVKKTPKNIDGSYREYMAKIAYKISLAHHALGEFDKALKRAKSAAKIYPWKDEYKAWVEELNRKSSSKKQ